MKNLDEFQAPDPEEMKELVASLSPAEQPTLNDPILITEDEAENIMCDRALQEPGKPLSLDQLFRENGQTRRTKTA